MIDEQSKFFYESEYFIRYSEMDYKRRLKPSAFLNFLQDTATNAADIGKFGYEQIVDKGLGWYLLKYHMEFDKYPAEVQDLIIKTEARGCNKLFAQRDFEIYTKENELLARVLSYWTLVKLEDKSIVSPSSVFEEVMRKVEKRDDDLSFNKVHQVERVDYTADFKVRFDDIDVNGHVNNMHYIVWAFEALPKEYRDNHLLKTLDMVYKKEVQYGNEILTEAQIDDNFVKIVVKNKVTGDDLCVIEAEFS